MATTPCMGSHIVGVVSNFQLAWIQSNKGGGVAGWWALPWTSVLLLGWGEVEESMNKFDWMLDMLATVAIVSLKWT